MTDDMPLCVLMTPSAATNVLKALGLAAGRLEEGLSPEPPYDKRDLRAWEAVQWLNWLGGRIRLAEENAKQEGAT